VSVFHLVAQQPRLSSIRRDREELQKKIDKLEKRREECVRAKKLDEVLSSNILLCSIIFVHLCTAYSFNYANHFSRHCKTFNNPICADVLLKSCSCSHESCMDSSCS